MTVIDRHFFETLTAVPLESEPKLTSGFFEESYLEDVFLELHSEPKPPLGAQHKQTLKGVQALQLPRLPFEPLCDLSGADARLPLRSFALPSRLFACLSGSILVHALAVAFFLFGVKFDLFLSKPDEKVVEVTFGVELPGQFVPPPKSRKESSDKPAQEQATKLEEQLPQLPQRLEVKTKSPETAESEMVAPDAVAQDDKIGQEQKLPKAPPIEPKEQTKSLPDPKAIVAPERDKDAQKIDINTLIERMKKEDRKVADKEKTGQKADSDKAADADLAIPDNPLADPLNAPVPNMPSAIAPSGSLAGRKLAGSALEAYKTAALVHMKRFWNIPGIVEFPPTLVARAVVVLDLFGKIQSVGIDQSSGNKDFDELVIKQIRQAEPFPDFPANSARTEKVYMLFRPQTID